MRLKFSFLPGLALLSACTVGQDYAGPPSIPGPPSAEGRFVRADSSSFDNAAPALAPWWEALDDPLLVQLEQQALFASPDISAAEARLRQARAVLREQRADDLPNVSASAAYLHARLPGIELDDMQASEGEGTGATATDFFNLGFVASWEADLFGGRRRALEAAAASVDRAEASLADAQVVLSAAVAQTYIRLREVQQRIDSSRRDADLQRQQLELVRQQFERGTVSQIAVERRQFQIDDFVAQSLPLEAEAEALANALAVLTGQAPGMLDPVLVQPAAIPMPPGKVSIGDPVSLIRRRPDIRMAERLLAEQTARIGVAEAARFPRLNFLGILGIGGTDLGSLGNLDDFTAIAAPVLQWNLFDFGRIEAQLEQSRGARDEALAQYRSTVLAALQDAEDALSRFRYRRQVVAGLARATQSSDRTYDLTEQRYEQGTTTKLDLLEAERTQIVAQQSLASAKAALTEDFVAIQKALGLGWQSAAEPQPGQVQ